MSTTVPATSQMTSDDKYALDSWMGPVALGHTLGTHLFRAHTTCYGEWSYAVQGGALGTYNIGIFLPQYAIIRNVCFDTVTAVTTSASGTLAFTCLTSGDLKGATAAASWSAQQLGTPVFATASTWLKVTSASGATLTCTIATGALTAGVVRVFVDYIVSSAT